MAEVSESSRKKVKQRFSMLIGDLRILEKDLLDQNCSVAGLLVGAALACVEKAERLVQTK